MVLCIVTGVAALRPEVFPPHVQLRFHYMYTSQGDKITSGALRPHVPLRTRPLPVLSLLCRTPTSSISSPSFSSARPVSVRQVMAVVIYGASAGDPSHGRDRACFRGCPCRVCYRDCPTRDRCSCFGAAAGSREPHLTSRRRQEGKETEEEKEMPPKRRAAGEDREEKEEEEEE